MLAYGTTYELGHFKNVKGQCRKIQVQDRLAGETRTFMAIKYATATTNLVPIRAQEMRQGEFFIVLPLNFVQLLTFVHEVYEPTPLIIKKFQASHGRRQIKPSTTKMREKWPYCRSKVF
jgi:hypothetical protein